MGLFRDYTYSGGCGEATGGRHFLRITIDDGDIATIRYAPVSGTAAGICYLGYERREYFEDPSASDPVDTSAEADGLAAWARAVTGHVVQPFELRAMLAESGRTPEEDFVEDTARRLPRSPLPTAGVDQLAPRSLCQPVLVGDTLRILKTFDIAILRDLFLFIRYREPSVELA